METRRSSVLDATLEDGKTKTDSGCRELADTEESMNGGWARDDRCRTYRCTGVCLTECAATNRGAGKTLSQARHIICVPNTDAPRSIVSLGH